MILKLIRFLIGKLSDKDKEVIKVFIENSVKAAAEGAAQGAMNR